MARSTFWIAVGLVTLVGCARSDRYIRMLSSADPAVRASGASHLGAMRERRAVPDLIARLSDSDDVVRSHAALSLRRIGGRSFGFETRAPLAERNRAIERWWSWWNAAEGRAPATQPGAG